MDFNNINKETIIICNNDNKHELLNDINLTNKLYPIHFLNMDQLIKKYYFDYNEKTIYYLMKKYNIKEEIAKIYINNIYYIDNKQYNSDKLNKLVDIKNYLLDNNLLIFDESFKEYIKNKDIIIYKYDINKYQHNLIKELQNITNVTIINKQYNNYNHIVYNFNTIDEEVEYVAIKICELINNGIDINSIKLTNINNDYNNVIKRIFKLYNLPINMNNNISIYSTKVVKDFISNFSNDVNDTFNKIDKYKDTNIYNILIDICNKYTWCDNYSDVKDMIIYDIKNTSIPNIKYNNAINIVDYKDNNIKDDYVFMLNFNLGIIPKIYKDEDYINDAIKPITLEDTITKNKIEKEITINSINNIKNLIITYKLKTPTSVFYPSNLIELYEVKTPNIDINKSYSIINDKIKLAKYLDLLVKYGYKNNELITLYSNYNIPYLEYNNQYSKIDKELLKEYLNNKLNLSYTTLENYNECSFKYYLSSILKLDIYEDNFAAILGTIFHHILELGVRKDINISEEVDTFIKDEYKNRIFSKKELFFINKTKEDMLFVLNTIKQQMKNTKLDKIMTEKKIYINKEGNISVTFTGIIDKLLYKETNDNTIVAIIDYKTGNTDIELGYLKEGLHLQLPIYLYLAANLDLKNIVFAGIYLQKVMPGIDKIDFKGKDSKTSKLKLEGYSTSDQNILELFDITYKDSEVIKSMKTKSDGDFYSYSKVLNNNDINTIIKLTDKEIDKCIKGILDAKFDINPKQEENDKTISACKYCKFNDICFRKPKDVIKIKKDNELSYLGGDDNA